MIDWNPDLVALQLGPLAVRWYSLLWTIGLAAAYGVVYRLYKHQGIGQEKFDPLFFYCFFGILIGARLGHCLLYEPSYFLAHPMEMILPMKQDAMGNWHFTGYAGLASHGGTAGIILAVWLYIRKTKISWMRVMDNIAIATPLTAGCIRLGNLMNSEIVGKYTESDYGFIFRALGDTQPRHPGQLYEAIAYFILFPIVYLLYRKWSEKAGTGFFFGFVLTYIFSFRLFVEFFKEVQEPWEIGMQQAILLNQGQLLSLPFIAAGIFLLLGGGRRWGDTGYISQS